MNVTLNASLLADFLEHPDQGIKQQGQLIAYPQQWQVPAMTEKAAYESMLQNANSLDFAYIGFPWATLIDSFLSDTFLKWGLVRKLDTLRQCLTAQASARRVTVAQHIHADRYMLLFKACGITDLFWSHSTVGREEIEGIRIHPFPLFPAQTPNGPEQHELERPRRLLANFIGAYTPGLYMTDVRDHIFRDSGQMNDVLIIRRDRWHFHHAVYDQQINGVSPDDVRVALERQHKEEYLQAIRDSVFTLCPTGSGPNSIRIGEALALGSIPVILTRGLALPGDRDLWEAACLFEEDSEEGYRAALQKMRFMNKAEIIAKQNAIRDLLGFVGVRYFGNIICSQLSGAAG